MNTPQTYLALITLHRSSKIRVKNHSGDFTFLSPNIVTWVDPIDQYNIRQLNHHTSIHQFISIGQWVDLFCGPIEEETNLDESFWAVAVRALNRSARIRVKGWQYGDDLENPGYGLHTLKVDRPTYIYIGYAPYDVDGESNRGPEDEGDYKFNRQQLGHHSAIGQYIVTANDDYTGILGLNDSAGVRLYNQDGMWVKARTNAKYFGPLSIESATAEVTGGTLGDNTEYFYAIAPTGIEPNYKQNMIGDYETISVLTDNSSVDSNSVTLSWTPVVNATGYKIYRNLDGNFDSSASLIAIIENPLATKFVDVGDEIQSETPNPWWWPAVVWMDLTDEKAIKSLNTHAPIGQYIVWPWGLNNTLPG